MPRFLPQTPLAALSTINLVCGPLPHPPPLLNVNKFHLSTTLESSLWTTPCRGGNTVTFRKTNGDPSVLIRLGLHPKGMVTAPPPRVLQQVANHLSQQPPPLVVSGPGSARGPPSCPPCSTTLGPILNPALAFNNAWGTTSVRSRTGSGTNSSQPKRDWSRKFSPPRLQAESRPSRG